MIFGLIISIIALVKGEIHNNKELAYNALIGFVVGMSPHIFDLINGATELFKMLASFVALGVASISFYRAWKFKDKN